MKHTTLINKRRFAIAWFAFLISLSAAGIITLGMEAPSFWNIMLCGALGSHITFCVQELRLWMNHETHHPNQ